MACKKCLGRGHLESYNKYGVPVTTRCSCKLQEDAERYVERVWPGMMDVPSAEKNRLFPFIEKNLWITSTNQVFKTYLKKLILDLYPRIKITVTSDANLMASWLATVPLQGGEIFDVDAASISSKHWTLMDLVIPPKLLVVEMGVKVASNVALPDVFLEALTLRSHYNLPTWIMDQPKNPLSIGHKAFSEAVDRTLEGWDHVDLIRATKKTASKKDPSFVPRQISSSDAFSLKKPEEPKKPLFSVKKPGKKTSSGGGFSLKKGG